MNFSVISDIHGDLFKLQAFLNEVKDKVNFIIICGDLFKNEYQNEKMEFMVMLNDFDKPVYIIPGNHDYYGFSLKDEFTDCANIKFINNRFTIIEDKLVLIGGSMWTESYINPRFGDVHGFNDFRYIKDINQVENVRTEFKKVVKDACEVAFVKDCKVIIATHHAPHEKSVSSMFKGSSINKFFYDNVDESIFEKIDYWCHGHMHNTSNYKIKGCEVICNPIGYPHEKVDFNYKIYGI